MGNMDGMFFGASDCLGHASAGIKFDLYGHLMPSEPGDVAEPLDAFIRRALSPCRQDATRAETRATCARERSRPQAVGV